jgi:hypothetical protein
MKPTLACLMLFLGLLPFVAGVTSLEFVPAALRCP